MGDILKWFYDKISEKFMDYYFSCICVSSNIPTTQSDPSEALTSSSDKCTANMWSEPVL